MRSLCQILFSWHPAVSETIPIAFRQVRKGSPIWQILEISCREQPGSRTDVGSHWTRRWPPERGENRRELCRGRGTTIAGEGGNRGIAYSGRGEIEDHPPTPGRDSSPLTRLELHHHTRSRKAIPVICISTLNVVSSSLANGSAQTRSNHGLCRSRIAFAVLT